MRWKLGTQDWEDWPSTSRDSERTGAPGTQLLRAGAPGSCLGSLSVPFLIPILVNMH